jgi:hypothetical protein
MVAAGLVQSLAQPGGNVTGVTLFAPELDGKRQELLIKLLRGVRRMAALADPRVQSPQQLQALEDAARDRGIELSIRIKAQPYPLSRANRKTYTRSELDWFLPEPDSVDRIDVQRNSPDSERFRSA